jgi:hypothetical protein
VGFVNDTAIRVVEELRRIERRWEWTWWSIREFIVGCLGRLGDSCAVRQWPIPIVWWLSSVGWAGLSVSGGSVHVSGMLISSESRIWDYL